MRKRAIKNVHLDESEHKLPLPKAGSLNYLKIEGKVGVRESERIYLMLLEEVRADRLFNVPNLFKRWWGSIKWNEEMKGVTLEQCYQSLLKQGESLSDQDPCYKKNVENQE
jgi:hypothetical protein